MDNLENLIFYNPTKGNLNFNAVIDEVFSFLHEQKEREYEIIVGCDSSSEETPVFPLALVVLRKGFGGRFFLAKMNRGLNPQKFYSFRQRILQEVLLSCEMALNFRDALRIRTSQSQENLNYQFEYIHADVGGSAKTQEMIKEVVGLIKSNGFEAKIKPESFAASVVADRYT